jgi:hypothetical protein
MRINFRWKLVLVMGLLVLMAAAAACSNNKLTSTTTAAIPATTATQVNPQPIEVVMVSGPLQPINPGGPVIEITLKNIGSVPVTNLSAILELGRPFTFDFAATVASPLLPGQTISSRQTLIGGGFGDSLYPLTINGATQNGVVFHYIQPIRVLAP